MIYGCHGKRRDPIGITDRWLCYTGGRGVPIAGLANAADPDNQIYDESPDGRFGFRDSSASTAKTEESDTDLVSAIEVVEISSKRVVLPSPKEALTPVPKYRRRGAQAWSSDSKHIALNFQTGPRTWTTALYEWDGDEFAQVSWPREDRKSVV